MSDERWPSEWLRGVLELCVLAVLDSEGSSYGYAVAQRLEDAGLGTVKGGTLYPLLARLERDGLVRTSWAPGAAGPGRKYVALTEDGRAELAARAASWSQFVAGTARLLPGGPPAASGPGAAARTVPTPLSSAAGRAGPDPRSDAR